MNYITEIKAFYDWLAGNPLPSSAIALWHALMAIANGANWVNKISPSMSTLQSKSGLGKDSVIEARNKLKQCGRIEWRSRGGSQSAVYIMIPFVSATATQNPPQSPPQDPTQNPTQSPPQDPPIYKLNETKRNERNKKESYDSKKEKPERNIIPPTVEMVERYCLMRGNGISGEAFVDFYASKGWKIGKDKMVDWQSAVRTWEKNRKEESQGKVWKNLD